MLIDELEYKSSSEASASMDHEESTGNVDVGSVAGDVYVAAEIVRQLFIVTKKAKHSAGIVQQYQICVWKGTMYNNTPNIESDMLLKVYKQRSYCWIRIKFKLLLSCGCTQLLPN